MERALAALLLAGLPLLSACGDDGPPDTTGDSVTGNTQTEAPGPAPTSTG